MLREDITKAVGEYSATVMVDNPDWVFQPAPAIILVNQIISLFTEELDGIENPHKDCYDGNDPETQHVNDIAELVWDTAIQAMKDKCLK